jgi:glutathione S-transferase
MSNDLRLYHSAASPNSRRVRIFLAEKGIAIPLAPVDLAKGEQHSDAYRAINPQRVVPTLVLEDGTAIGEVPAIWRYLEESFRRSLCSGRRRQGAGCHVGTARRTRGLCGRHGRSSQRHGTPQRPRAIAGPHDYDQIPALAERSRLRVKNFYADIDTRLAEAPYVAGNMFSAADITALVTVDFATKAMSFSVPSEHAALERWYENVSSRPSVGA